MLQQILLAAIVKFWFSEEKLPGYQKAGERNASVVEEGHLCRAYVHVNQPSYFLPGQSRVHPLIHTSLRI